jgi:biopolymer transport protein ExbB
MLLALFLLPAALPLARAEEPASPPKSEAPARKQPETLLELILAGGPLNLAFLGVLGLFSLAGFAVILERLVNLTQSKIAPPAFLRELHELTRRREDDPQVFQELCSRHPSVISNVLKAGLARAGRPLAEVEKAMEDVAARELAVLRSRVRPLTVLSSVGPLVGLLGTAVGMILVFRTASQVGPGKAELLAEGIYLKLETTVAGLLVAIPSVLFAAVFNARSEKLVRLVDEHLAETIPCFIRMEANHSASRSPTAGLRDLLADQTEATVPEMSS